MLKIKCDLSVAGNACGMKSNADGVIMIVSNADGEIEAVTPTSGAVSNTYVMEQE